MRFFVVVFAALVLAGPAAAGGWCKPAPPVPPPVVVQPPRVCADGLPPDAGKDGWVPASGNTNDDCDHSGDPRLNNGVDSRTREG